MPYRILRLPILVLCAALLAACGDSALPTHTEGPQPTATLAADSGAPADMGPPSIRGPITNVQLDDGGGTLLVEGAVEPDTSFDKASVRITPQTRILERTGADLQPASSDALTVGTRVEAYFTGPVAESYPVQASASTVVILR